MAETTSLSENEDQAKKRQKLKKGGSNAPEFAFDFEEDAPPNNIDQLHCDRSGRKRMTRARSKDESNATRGKTQSPIKARAPMKA